MTCFPLWVVLSACSALVSSKQPDVHATPYLLREERIYNEAGKSYFMLSQNLNYGSVLLCGMHECAIRPIEEAWACIWVNCYLCAGEFQVGIQSQISQVLVQHAARYTTLGILMFKLAYISRNGHGKSIEKQKGERKIYKIWAWPMHIYYYKLKIYQNKKICLELMLIK